VRARTRSPPDLSPPNFRWLVLLGLIEQLSQDVRQNAAVLVVLNLDRSVDTQRDRDSISPATGVVDEESGILAGFDLIFETDKVKNFGAVQL